MTQTHRSRFSASSKRTGSDFYHLMQDLDATSLHIDQEISTSAAEVHFDRQGMRYIFRCEKWKSTNDNLRAIYHTIRFLYKALTEYGVVKSEEQSFDEIFQSVFAGFLITPDAVLLGLPSGDKPWYEFLGVAREASESAIRNAYRALAKTLHPDAGGDEPTFHRLTQAYNAGLAAAKMAKPRKVR